jgi:hypothetical protein
MLEPSQETLEAIEEIEKKAMEEIECLRKDKI